MKRIELEKRKRDGKHILFELTRCQLIITEVNLHIIKFANKEIKTNNKRHTLSIQVNKGSVIFVGYKNVNSLLRYHFSAN